PMAATQSHGRWSRAFPLALPAGAAAQPYAQVSGIACHSAGNCVAVGDYQYGRSGNTQAFVAIESHGAWARAFTPRLPVNAASPSSALLEAVSCPSDGSCEAVGNYLDSSGNAQTMVLAKPSAGPWGQATEIASPPNAATNPDALMTGIACTVPGSCAAVGSYSVSASQFAAMGAVEVRGAWHRATQITLPHGAIPSTFTAMNSVSCPRPSQCLGVGQYAVSATQSRAMTVTESKGRFSPGVAITAVPRGARLRSGTYLLDVACRPPGTCLAVRGGGDSSRPSGGRCVSGGARPQGGRRLGPPGRDRAAADVRPVLGGVHRPGSLHSGRVLLRPLRPHPRRGGLHVLIPLRRRRRSAPGPAGRRRCPGAQGCRAAAAAGRWVTRG